MKISPLLKITERTIPLAMVLVLWFLLGHIIMLLLRHYPIPVVLLQLQVCISSFIPSLSKLDAINYLDPLIAKTYASMMISLIPLMILSIPNKHIKESTRNVKVKGRRNSINAGLFLLVSGILGIFFLFGIHTKGVLLFRKNWFFFALQSCAWALWVSYFLRESIDLLFRK